MGPRRWKLQRLFSTFPGGMPGVGLLLLRTTVAGTALTQGALYLNDHGGSAAEGSAIGLALGASGTVLLIGLLTRLASTIVALITIAIAVSWLPPAARNLFDAPLAVVFVVSVAVALGMLGPGAVSLDCRLFGRREIIIPAPRQSPEL